MGKPCAIWILSWILMDSDGTWLNSQKTPNLLVDQQGPQAIKTNFGTNHVWTHNDVTCWQFLLGNPCNYRTGKSGVSPQVWRSSDHASECILVNWCLGLSPSQLKWVATGACIPAAFRAVSAGPTSTYHLPWSHSYHQQVVWSTRQTFWTCFSAQDFENQFNHI